MEKRSKHAYSKQGLRHAFTKKEKNMKDKHSCTRQEMAQTFCAIILIIIYLIQMNLSTHIYKQTTFIILKDNKFLTIIDVQCSLYLYIFHHMCLLFDLIGFFLLIYAYIEART